MWFARHGCWGEPVNFLDTYGGEEHHSKGPVACGLVLERSRRWPSICRSLIWLAGVWLARSLTICVGGEAVLGAALVRVVVHQHAQCCPVVLLQT